jgi:phosphopantetheine adenylyltransferase
MAQKTLLLLPPPPEPATYAAVKASYNAPLLLALRSSSSAGSPSILDIALPCPDLHRLKEAPREASYASVQTVLAKVYKLVTILAARDRINVEDTSGVDVRVLLISYPRDGKIDTAELKNAKPVEGPVIDIGTLGRSHARWSKVLAVESEEGEQILKNFAAFGVSRAAVQKVRGGLVSVDTSRSSAPDIPGASRAHFHPAVGGTFDHLHIGHKLLLTMTIFMSDAASSEQERAVTVGITAEDLLKNKKYAEFLEDWHDRYAATHAFIHALMSFDPNNDHPEEISEVKNPGPNGHIVIAKYPSGLQIKYTEIWDPFGPTITEEAVDSLVISAETRAGGKAVNDKRKEQGWRELDVYEVDVLDADEPDNAASESAGKSDAVQQEFQNKLSSTEIRKKQALSMQGRSKV